MRTCEENLARRAWASAYHRQRQLQQLLEQPAIRRVYTRDAEAALESQHPQRIAKALEALQAEVSRTASATTHPLFSCAR